MSSVPDRKFNSILKRIPVETILEVIKFLTYEQWFVLQFSNWRLAEIIKKNVNYLAFPKLRRIDFYRYPPQFINPRNITYDGIEAKNENLGEKEKSDLTEAFSKLNQVPLALFPSDENPNDNFVYIFIKTTENAKGRRRLLIKLPIHPSAIEDLALIRFWLLKLSQINFKELDANRCILNPEFLSVLNPRTGPRKILFRAYDVEVNESGKADFAEFICCSNNMIVQLEGSNLEEFCQVLVKSIMHMETSRLENVPEMITCYGRRCGGRWPNISRSKFTGVDGPFGRQYSNKKLHYSFNNLWSKKVMFCLELYGQEYEFPPSFEIVKITTKK